MSNIKDIKVGEAKTGFTDNPNVMGPSENLSPRIKRQRAYYFADEKRPHQNDIVCYTTGIEEDIIG